MGESLDRGTRRYPFCVTPETDPPQSEEVAQAIGDLLAGDDAAPDPWWQAGIDESVDE